MKKHIIVYIISLIIIQILLITFNSPPYKMGVLTIIIASLLAIDLYGKIKKSQQDLRKSKYNPEKDLQTANLVQEALLDIDPPTLNMIQIAKRCKAAKNLGGDFYTFINKTVNNLSQDKDNPGILEYKKKEENILGIAVGDVAGHGVSSALVMALASGLIGRIAHNYSSPALILEKSNNEIQRYIAKSIISHVTAFYCNLNLDTLTLCYSNAGHPSALILHQDDSFERITTNGLFLGMYKNEIYEEKLYQLKKGDRLFIFTDGIIETMDQKRDSYGSKRLMDLCIKHKEKNVNDLLDIVFIEIKRFSGDSEQKDDETLIIVDLL
jgi:sigma-B regulation protein RsbU (phosphoserine phosphatase)